MTKDIFSQDYPVTTPFGWRTHPFTGKKQFHNGIDYKTPVGTEILCPWHGIVSDVWVHSHGGLSMRVKHRNGYTTGYGHLHECKFKKGDKVYAGDVIALTGNTGRSTGPHLHFTLRDEKNELICPLKFAGLI
jgi:murein DD-endopeptidase MepM/ murein hydrolase activator NlpD